MSDLIFFNGASFRCCLGVTDEEQSQPQEVLLDVELTAELLQAGESDDLSNTIDYSEVWKAVRQQVEDNSYRLLESLAHRVATMLLERFATVDRVTVRATKPAALRSHNVSATGVKVTRSRGERGG
jgi:dihydroneopterin aldolase